MARLFKGDIVTGRRWEILNLPEKHDGWYYNIQLAVDEVVCVPFSLHSSACELYATSQEFEEMLVRQAVALIGQFGDARRPDAWLGRGGDA